MLLTVRRLAKRNNRIMGIVHVKADGKQFTSSINVRDFIEASIAAEKICVFSKTHCPYVLITNTSSLCLILRNPNKNQ